MTPAKVIIGKATIYLGDCGPLLQSISADALISDVPYGKGEPVQRRSTRLSSVSAGRGCRHRQEMRRDAEPIEGDDRPFDPQPLLRFDKVVLCGANHFASRLPDASKWIVWDKREGGTSDDNADCELIWTNLGGPARIHRQLWRGMIRRGEENGQRLVHPTPKPIALMTRLIAECRLPPGATILDPYMGCGTTGVAAVRGGYSFIGIEKVPKYFEEACRRISEAQMQGHLLMEGRA